MAENRKAKHSVQYNYMSFNVCTTQPIGKHTSLSKSQLWVNPDRVGPGGFSLSCTFQADSSRDLDAVELFKLEHYVAVVRREYVESYESRNPPSVTRTQLKKALTERGNAPFTTHHS